MNLLQWLLIPVFIQVALIATVGLLSGRARLGALKTGRTKLRDIALNDAAWPDDVMKSGNNFNNQFQMPMMFFAVVGILIGLNALHIVHVVLAFAFVASRILHSWVHLRSNNVRERFKAYLVGFAALFAMWIWLAAQVFLKV